MAEEQYTDVIAALLGVSTDEVEDTRSYVRSLIDGDGEDE